MIMARKHYNSSQYKMNRLKILHRDDFTCYYCKREATTVDHVIPISKGGTNEESNLVAACKTCNSAKRDRGVSFLSKRKTVDPFHLVFTPDQTERPESGFKLPNKG